MLPALLAYCVRACVRQPGSLTLQALHPGSSGTTRSLWRQTGPLTRGTEAWALQEPQGKGLGLSAARRPVRKGPLAAGLCVPDWPAHGRHALGGFAGGLTVSVSSLSDWTPHTTGDCRRGETECALSGSAPGWRRHSHRGVVPCDRLVPARPETPRAGAGFSQLVCSLLPGLCTVPS